MKFDNMIILIVIVAIIIFCFSIVPIGLQNDTFYTIKLGELILENGIDMQEHFAWHEGMPYTYPHWMFDVLIFCIYNYFFKNIKYKRRHIMEHIYKTENTCSKREIDILEQLNIEYNIINLEK